MDLDLPAGHLDALDEEPEELLALAKVELVDASCDSMGEVMNSLPETIVHGERLPFCNEVIALLLE